MGRGEVSYRCNPSFPISPPDDTPDSEQCGEGPGLVQESHGSEMEGAGVVCGLHFQVRGGREAVGGRPFCSGGEDGL